ncbi:hypothetical protein [Paractinoplanes toevensis]|uniref:G domain-containing protein n=1 Tax=Paractinoplanes toevensis TaxID=571911 RepID=A0A919WC01_9ACTN|nr:hypothetical protein [Actinoplanes toevensis]GIM97383.1 hypothetical protein Ato02nite_091760 [Actinoplanes toevensis]
MSGAGLAERAGRLLDDAAQVFRGHERAETWLRRHRERLVEPLRLAVAGPPGSGKSTLVNALIGEDVAPVVVEGAGGAPVWFQDGPRPVAHVFPPDAPAWTAPMRRAKEAGHAVDWALGGVSRVVVDWPCRALRHTRLLDAAGVEGDTEVPADALLYVTRHLGDDLTPLQESQSGRGAGAFPVHVMVVLSRADETAGGRPDAILGARQIARRRRREPRVAALCQDVLALSGQLALAGRGLREEEYASVAAVAALPKADADARLLSTDRFTAAGFGVDVPVQRREALLRRFGIGGLRLAVTLVRSGARSRAELGAQLMRQSGLTELQASISDLFTARRDALKARTALIALDHLLRAESRPQAAHLVAELDRLVAGAHEFRELRLLAALRTGRVTLPAELAVEARRLAGGEGTAHAERLGLPAESPPEQLWPVAEDAAGRWHQQTRAATTAGGRRAAEVVLRSCTAILDDLG